LLAYLDDTLDPAQTKLIGQKVAESDTAQELVARIKQVTRRRRLTTPVEAGPGGKIDPNTIAEYLDNAVGAEQQADIEQICLASDVHLAEVAACHQILTLVLGEPALVPPPAKQRMYGLVKGPEAIPFRKPPVRGAEREHEVVEEKETDVTLRLGLPAYRRKGSWSQRLILLGGAVAAAALLVFAILQVMNPEGPAKTNQPVLVAQNDKDKAKPEPAGHKDKKNGEAVAKKNGPDADRKDAAEKKEPIADVKDKHPSQTDKDKKPIESDVPAKLPFDKPSARQVLVGEYATPSTKEISILLQPLADRSDWHRIGVKKPEAYSARPLVSLPGCRSFVDMKSGVRLLLWGYLPELWPYNANGVLAIPPVLESLVELHHVEKPLVDLDMTLHRGRIVVMNTREGSAHVRIRFENPTNPESHEFFDITMQKKGTELLLDRWSSFSPTERFFRNPKNPLRLGPAAQMGLMLLAGEAYLRYGDVSARLDMQPGPSVVFWSSVKGQLFPARLDKVPDAISTNPPLPDKIPEEVRKNMLRARSEALRARDELGTDMSTKEVDVVLKEAVTAPKDPAKRALAVRCFGALDDLSSLMGALDQDNFPDVRYAAAQTMQAWIASSRDAEYRLHKLFQDRYGLLPAVTLMSLLHNTFYSEQAQKDPTTYDSLIGYLDNDLMPIRELAAFHLYRLVPSAASSIGFRATDPREFRRKTQEAWRRIIPPGKLPQVAPK
jgi:hypothetical protein